MLKSAASKVMWMGRTTVFAVGLAVILALLFVVANMVLGVGGEPTISSEPGEINGSTWLVESDAGEERMLEVEPVARRRAPQGYAHVNNDGTFDPARSKGVNGVVESESTVGVYCFDLTFVPNVVVGSPFINNNATVATATPPDNFTGCPEGYRDAAVRTYAANTSEPVSDVSFKIMFR